MLKRYLSGIILALLLFPLIWFGSPLHFYLVSLVVILLAGREIIAMLNTAGLQLSVPFVLAAMALFSISVYVDIMLTIPVILILCFLFYMPRNLDLEKKFHAIVFSFFAICYAGGLLTFVPIIRRMNPAETGRHLLLFFIIVNYMGDTGAYHIGKSMGKHKLAPVISPKKTVEGAIGSIIMSMAAALLCTRLFCHEFTYVESIAAAFIINIPGQFGDLAESILKRATGVKDSGNLIPGHGGVLDRTDSLFFSAPFFVYWVLLTS